VQRKGKKRVIISRKAPKYLVSKYKILTFAATMYKPFKNFYGNEETYTHDNVALLRNDLRSGTEAG
jgi:hypothetical protein